MPAHRKSIAVKKLAGTDRPHRRLRADAVGRLLDPPPPPRSLSARARAEWRRLAADAVAVGTLTATDLRSLQLLAETLTTAAEAAEIVARDGYMVATADGGSKKHPAVSVLETARSQARALLDSFGLSPRGRQSVDTARVAAEREGAPDAQGFAKVRALRGGRA